MCFDPLSIALAAGGFLLQQKAQSDALERQDEAAIRARQRQDEFEERARRVVQRVVEEQDPTERVPRLETLQDEATDRIDASLERARTEGPGNLNVRVQGRVSPAFIEEEARAVKEEIEKAARLARILGKVRGPDLLRQEEIFSQAQAGNELFTNANFARGAAGVDDLKIQAAGRVSPALSLAGEFLTAAGVSGAGSRALEKLGGPPVPPKPKPRPPGLGRVTTPSGATLSPAPPPPHFTGIRLPPLR